MFLRQGAQVLVAEKIVRLRLAAGVVLVIGSAAALSAAFSGAPDDDLGSETPMRNQIDLIEKFDEDDPAVMTGRFWADVPEDLPAAPSSGSLDVLLPWARAHAGVVVLRLGKFEYSAGAEAGPHDLPRWPDLTPERRYDYEPPGEKHSSYWVAATFPTGDPELADHSWLLAQDNIIDVSVDDSSPVTLNLLVRQEWDRPVERTVADALAGAWDARPRPPAPPAAASHGSGEWSTATGAGVQLEVLRPGP